MPDVIRLSDRLSIGGQPNASDLAGLKRDGFHAVVNLRTDGEENQPLSPEAEGEAVRAEGLDYLHIPVSGSSMTPEQADEFVKAVSEMQSPVYVHCHRGTRAGVFALIALARDAGWSGDEAL